MPVYDALYDSDIRHVTMAHEQGAAHAADAYGIVSGEPGVCLATSGPGATNLVTGIADADMDSDPLLALTGQVPTEFVGNDAFQETDTTGVTTPITKDNTFASDSDRVGSDVSEAFALAGAGRPGPTLVDLPKDVTNGETDCEPDAPAVPDTYRVQKRADPEIVAAAAERIENADRPAMLLGGGVIKGEASEACREFAIEHEIPVITTMPGIGAFPEDHELSLEMAGMHGTGYANMAITHCDTLIGIGTRFDDRLTGGIETFAPDAELIHVDIDPAEISKNIHADYPLIGDAETVVEQLSEAVDTSPEAKSGVHSASSGNPTIRWPTTRPEDEPVQPEFVVEALDEATSDRAIVTTGVGQHQMWACQYWTYTEPPHLGLESRARDDGLRAALGDRRATCSRRRSGGRLHRRRRLVPDDAAGAVGRRPREPRHHGCRAQQRVHRHGSTVAGRLLRRPSPASDYHWMPEFDKLAEAFGASGYRIDDYDDVAETIDAAIAYDGPSVIDVHIDPDANVYPMVPSGGDNGQFALTEDQL